MFAQHHRFQIWNISQHPYKHSLTEFPYANAALPDGSVVSLGGAMDWLFAVLYPQTKPAVATVADLPAIGNTLNDYRVVEDDGDGKSAAYRWEKREGEAAASWHKIYDMDWGSGAVLEAWQTRAQDQFVMRRGYDDIDNAGVKVAGTLAGQSVFGGVAASSNLTLWANAGDGAGAVTGYIQFATHQRPIITAVYDLGTTALKYRTAYLATSVVVSTMTLSGGNIADSSGAISFNALNLSTTGSVTGASLISGVLTITGPSITAAASAVINFGSNPLTTTGLVTANAVTATGAVSSFKSGTTVGHLTLSDGVIVDSSGSISFTTMNLSTSGTVGGGAATFTSGLVGALTLNGATLSTNAGALVLNSTSGTLTVSCTTVTMAGTLAVTTSIARGNTVITDGAITVGATATLTVTASTAVSLTSPLLKPTADATTALGDATHRYTSVFLGTGISDGTNAIAMATLLSFRDALVAAGAGMTLFYDGAKWNPSAPDTEITHSSLSGLTTTDAGHTQFAMLAGRTGGQTIDGDTAASGNLTLSSTAHATKGFIILTSTLQPTDATYGLGDATHRFVNLYLSGQAIGMRIENYTTVGAPAASAGTKGRLYYDTTTDDVFVDRGGAWNKLSIERSQTVDTTGWTGSATTVTYDVSADFTDARKGVWQLQKNASNNEIILCTIDFTDATHVRVTVDLALAAGTYTLVGIG